MPLFFIIVELTERRLSRGLGRLLAGRRILRRESAQKYTRPGKYRNAEREAVAPPSLQKSRTNPGITYLKLHEPNHLPQVVQWAMKRKKRGPNATDIQVGESIRVHRLIAGMSQQALADRLGVSFQQVQKYENGTNRVGAGRLPQIAEILNIPISACSAPTQTRRRAAARTA